MLAVAQAQAGPIQDAIDAAEPGDSVEIAAGMYSGSVVLKEGISLVGDGAATTLIDGAGAEVIVTGAKNAMIVGFTIQNGQVGVHIDQTSTHVLECHIRRTAKYAIQFNGGFGVIGNSLLQGNGWAYGIHSENANPHVFDTVIAGYSTGFMTRGPHTPTSIGNVYAGNKYSGILVSANASIVLLENGFFANGVDVRDFELDESDVLLAAPPALTVNETDATIEEYRAQIAEIMSDAFTDYPVVVYTLSDVIGDFGMAALHPRASFRVRASAADTDIVSYDAYDLLTQDTISSEFVTVDDYPAVAVSNPELTENDPDRYALDSVFRHSPSYFATEDGLLVFNRLTSYTRIEVVVPRGYIPVSSDQEAVYEWQDDRVVAKITDMGKTTVNLVMAPLPE